MSIVRFSFAGLLKYLSVLLLTFIILFICLYKVYADKKPWINKPIDGPTSIGKINLGSKILGDHTEDFSTIVALSFSGGGTRSAAFSYGVLEGLRDSKITRDNLNISLLDEVELVSGVSGGSILATYFVAFGAKTFTSFKDNFLYVNYQDNYVRAILRPSKFFELMSPWYGRGNLLTDDLNELFEEKTFGNLSGRPRLLVTATDLSSSTEFPFTYEQFALICSDLNSVPLAYAAGASSSVPLIFTPITLKNYSITDQCSEKPTLQVSQGKRLHHRERALLNARESYLNSPERKYIHLVDGAVTDNLGLRSLVDQLKTEGMASLVDRAPPQSVRRLVFIVVNSETNSNLDIQHERVVPISAQVINAIRSNTFSQAAGTLTSRLTEAIDYWKKEFKQGDTRSPFAKDAQVHLILINLRDIPNGEMREKLSRVPTTLQLPNDIVDELIVAGKQTLFSSPGYVSLMKELSR
jgi:NTE family protein